MILKKYNYLIVSFFLWLIGHDTGPGESGKKYRPLFLDHFDKKENMASATLHSPSGNDTLVQQSNEQVRNA